MNCPTCTFLNTEGYSQCEMCGTASSSQGLPIIGSSDDMAPSTCFVSDTSQFTFGGESACPFGTMELGSCLLTGKLKADADKKQEGPFRDALVRAVGHYEKYWERKGGPKGHANPNEIYQADPSMFPLEIVTWNEGMPQSLSKLASKIVFPEVFLPMGELQVQSFNEQDMLHLLQGFQGSNYVLSIVNIGYVFGVLCRADGDFIVFDTHSKSFDEFGINQNGAFLAKFSSAEKTSNFIINFTLSSRKQILAYAQGLHQQEAANKMEIIVFRTSGAPESKSAEDSDSTGENEEKKVTNSSKNPSVPPSVIRKLTPFVGAGGKGCQTDQSGQTPSSLAVLSEKDEKDFDNNVESDNNENIQPPHFTRKLTPFVGAGGKGYQTDQSGQTPSSLAVLSETDEKDVDNNAESDSNKDIQPPSVSRELTPFVGAGGPRVQSGQITSSLQALTENNDKAEHVATDANITKEKQSAPQAK